MSGGKKANTKHVIPWPEYGPSIPQGAFAFTYILPIVRLRAMFKDPFLRRRLKYREQRTTSQLDDVFDGTHFHSLYEKNVKWRGTTHQPEPKHF
jgi:hypothetical protein